MDERSPRQPDPSGSTEETDDTQARGARPENPYRIPQRPTTARSEDTGGFGHPRPADPVAPPSEQQAGERHGPHGEARNENSWGSWDSATPGTDQPAPASSGHQPDPEAADGWGTPVPVPYTGPPTPPGGTSSWNDTPDGQQAADSWDGSASAGQDQDWNRSEGWDDSYGETASAGQDRSEGRDAPYRGESAHQSDTPYPGGPPPPGGEQRNRAPDGPPQDQPGAEGFEYLYGGGAAPGGPGGPQGPDGFGDPYDPGPPPARKSRRGLLIGVVSAVVVLALVGGGVSWFVLSRPEPQEATAEYVAAWEEQDYERLAAVTTGDDAAVVLGGIAEGLGIEAVDVEVGATTADGGTGSAPYEVTVSMANADDWGWEGELPLVRSDGQWLVDFSPEVAYPGLGEGQVLVRTTVWGERGHILAADGTRLDSPDVSGSLQMIAGSVGEAAEEDVERLGPAYRVGDTVGLSGLQRTYEERLAGEAATTVLMVDAAEAEDIGAIEATEENTVTRLDGSDGQDIATSIDMSVQNAAASAVIGSDDPAGLVAVRPSTGEILAVANVPGGFNRAFEGQYPPGSSFKIITYNSLLDNGMTMDTTMNCPEEYDLGGWPFRNAGGGEYGAQSVTEAFATSCNTALVEQVGERLSSDTLQATAEQFGMNAPLDIGVPTLEPSFPPMDSSTMLGAQSIGQGQILTSPLHMATVPAAIADGSWRHPVLVTEPARGDMPEPTTIANAESIRPMMRAVITDGTAKSAGFQGEVYGKTGSAEFGTAEGEDDELPTHAWMVGYKGDVAFALVVEGGGGGGSVAGPIAAAFTNAL